MEVEFEIEEVEIFVNVDDDDCNGIEIEESLDEFWTILLLVFVSLFKLFVFWIVAVLLDLSLGDGCGLVDELAEVLIKEGKPVF